MTGKFRLRPGTSRPALLVLPALGLLVLFLALPLLNLVRTSAFDPAFTTEHYRRFFTTPVYFTVFWRTIGASFVVTTACFLVGYPAAYFLAHVRPALRTYLFLLILLPLWTSLLIRTYTWIAVLGRNGVVNSVLLDLHITSEPLPMLYTTGAVYLAMVQILLPIMILTCYSVMVEIDDGLVRAARVLGAGPWRAFFRVFFPLSRRSFDGIDHRLHALHGFLRDPIARRGTQGSDDRKPD